MVNTSTAPGIASFHAPGMCRVTISTNTSEKRDAIKMMRSATRSRGAAKAHSRKMQAMKHEYQSTYFFLVGFGLRGS